MSVVIGSPSKDNRNTTGLKATGPMDQWTNGPTLRLREVPVAPNKLKLNKSMKMA